MPAIKSLANISSKWSTVAGRSGDAYEAGVRDPRKDWKTEAAAANNNWKAGVQTAVTQNRFQTGVNRSSTENWKQNAIDKGVSRYQAGVQLATGNFEKGFSPYAETIKNTTLPDRKPKGDPANITRVAVMAKALHDKKLSLATSK
jgi:hypothetical protein